jgi:hypothetical protein
MLKQWFAAKVRNLLGAARKETPSVISLKVLEGTPYSRYLLPLDYLPSRDFHPRWGYSHPPHPGIEGLLSENKEDYRGVIRDMRFLERFLTAINVECSPETMPEPGWVGGPANALDLALLYYFVYRYRPTTYLEIGSGTTTCFARRAVRDHHLKTRIVSIDPEPRSSIDPICDVVIRDGLETANLSIFESLQPGDIVFMDGSHRSFMNSDVTVFMLDVMPRLKPGVLIHFHDILLPYDYPESFKTWYWNEQYQLGVYLLAARNRIRILFPAHWVAVTPGVREGLFPPLVDLKGRDDLWSDGGSLWFTHVT